jgi:hypothetical protein
LYVILGSCLSLDIHDGIKFELHVALVKLWTILPSRTLYCALADSFGRSHSRGKIYKVPRPVVYVNNFTYLGHHFRVEGSEIIGLDKATLPQTGFSVGLPPITPCLLFGKH